MERIEMIRNILFSSAGPATASGTAPTPSAETVIILWILSGAGILVFLFWLIRTRGRDPLARCPIRRHRLPFWFVPSQLLIWMIGSFLLLVLVKALFQETDNWRFEIVLNLVSMFWYAILLSLFLTAARFGFARGLKGFGFRWRMVGPDLLGGSLILVAVLPLIYTALQVTLYIGRLLAGPDFVMDQHASLTALSEFPQWWMRAVIVFNAVLVVPVFEEVLFRGLLQSTLTAQLGRPWISIAAVSVLFSMLHPYPTHLLPLFILSVALGYAYEKSGSLQRSIIIHVLFNGLNVTFTLLAA